MPLDRTKTFLDRMLKGRASAAAIDHGGTLLISADDARGKVDTIPTHPASERSIDDTRPLSASEICSAIDRSFPFWEHGARLEVLGKIMSTIGQYYRENGQAFLDGFPIVERHGLHLLVSNFYSPIANIDEVLRRSTAPLIDDDFGVDLDIAGQLVSFDRMVVPWLAELADIPMHDPGKAGAFFWLNGMFGPQDAATYYGLMRSCRPNHVIEIGSGYSTLIATMVRTHNATMQVTSIEPYPVEFFSRHLRSENGFHLIEKIVQDVDRGIFETLEANDILFIDSSHVVKPGSDVEFLIYSLLGRLKKGVIIHFHDIFLPFGYPMDFYQSQHRHWNENYVLAAYLAHNSRFEVILANAFLANRSDSPVLDRLCSGIVPDDAAKRATLRMNCGGGSLWLRKC